MSDDSVSSLPLGIEQAKYDLLAAVNPAKGVAGERVLMLIDALIAAVRHAPLAPPDEQADARLYDRCPACGHDTLVIHDHHLLCTWVGGRNERGCSNPVAARQALEQASPSVPLAPQWQPELAEQLRAQCLKFHNRSPMAVCRDAVDEGGRPHCVICRAADALSPPLPLAPQEEK